jgi:hypothetical protein
LDKIRALLIDSNFNKELWGEALYTLVYTMNRISTDTLQCSPYEMWNKRKSIVKNLQIFGSIAYAKRLRPLKMLDKRKKNYFL